MALNMKKSDDGTSIRIGEVRFSFAKVFTPVKNEETGKEKYSCSIVISKDNTEALTLVNNAIAAAAKIGAEKYWSGKVPPTLKKPLRDGDNDRPDDEAYENSMFLNASNPHKPGVQVLEDGIRFDANEEDFYSGCYGAAVLSFYPYDKKGNRGVAVSLGNLIKLRDGERLSGGGESADSSFSDLDL